MKTYFSVCLLITLACLPSIILMRFAYYLSRVRALALTSYDDNDAEDDDASEDEEEAEEDEDHEDRKDKHKTRKLLKRRRRTLYLQAVKEYKSFFSFLAMTLRYFLPALLMGLLCFFYLVQLFGEHDALEGLTPAESTGVRFGFWGAYLFTLLNFGRRNFVSDLTSGIAVWSVVQLAVGPILGGLLAHFWTVIPGNFQDQKDPTIVVAAIGFVAGMSPRQIAAAVAEIIRRLWLGSAIPAATAPKIIPLTQLRGVTLEIADRFAEEGIGDVFAMAYADPLRLIRNTPYDVRQIINWMDESMLIAILPMGYEKLEQVGFAGAIDLAWYYNASKDEVKHLAELLHLDYYSMKNTIIRLYEDAQVSLIWALYFDTKGKM